MEDVFFIGNTKYVVRSCVAIALSIGDTDYQEAVYVHSQDQYGEQFDYIVFGWTMDMLENDSDFVSMCEDSNSWSGDYDDLSTMEFTK